MRAYGCIVDNITNQWLYELGRRRFIPPYQAGVTIPLAGVVSDSITLQTPGNMIQATPIAGEYVTVSYTEDGQLAGLGINVGSFTAPPPVVVTDFQQGNKPAPPAAGVTRVWADLAGELHRELATAADAQVLDTASNGLVTAALLAAGVAASNVGALGGVLSGTLPNPGINLSAFSNRISGDLTNPATGTIVSLSSLPAGTYVVWVSCEILANPGPVNVSTQLVGGSPYNFSHQLQMASNAYVSDLIVGLVTLSATGTISLAMSFGGNVIVKALDTTSSYPATYIQALKVI